MAFICITADEMRQYHLEDFEDAYWDMKAAYTARTSRDVKGKSTDEGMIVRAAFTAGWFGAENSANVTNLVKNMRPAELVKLAQTVDATRTAARAIDPELFWRLAITSLGMHNRLDSYQKLEELKPGETATVTVGDNGGLAILNDTTPVSTSITPVMDINGAPPILSHG